MIREVPITSGFDQAADNIVGSATIRFPGISDAKFLNTHVLVPAYEKLPDGTIRLIELSWIPNGRVNYIKRKG